VGEGSTEKIENSIMQSTDRQLTLPVRVEGSCLTGKNVFGVEGVEDGGDVTEREGADWRHGGGAGVKGVKGVKEGESSKETLFWERQRRSD